MTAIFFIVALDIALVAEYLQENNVQSTEGEVFKTRPYIHGKRTVGEAATNRRPQN
jgi:hypothetical protein